MARRFLWSLTLTDPLPGLVAHAKMSEIAEDDLPRPASPPLLPGGYALANIVVDQWGRVIQASAGSSTVFSGATDKYRIPFVNGSGQLQVNPALRFDFDGSLAFATTGMLYLGSAAFNLPGSLTLYDTTSLDFSTLTTTGGKWTLRTAGGTPGTDELRLSQSGSTYLINFPKGSSTLTLSAASGSVVSIDSSGRFATGGSAINTNWQVTFPTGNQSFGSVDDNGSLLICGGSNTSAGGTIAVYGNSASFGNDGKVQLNASASSGGIVVLSINGVDVFRINHSKAVVVQPQADVVSLQIKAHTSQTANLQNWTDSSSTVLAKVTGAGKLYVGNLTAANAAVGGTVTDKSTSTGNVGTGEDDLHSYTTIASQFGADNDKLTFQWHVQTVAHATDTRRIRVYFAGTAIFDSTAQATTAADDIIVKGWIIRESSSVVRASVELIDSGGVAFLKTQYTRITGLTLTGTNILKITGESAGGAVANNDVVATMGTVKYLPAA